MGPHASPRVSSPPFFYGWVIVGVTFVAQFVTMGTVFYTFGVFLKPLTETLQTDRFSISLALTCSMAMGGVLGPIVGKLIAERSIRLLMLFGACLISLGFLALSQVQTLWQLYLAFGVLAAAGLSLAGPLPNNALITNWFVRRRGTAMGISQFGISISGTVMVPLATWLVLDYGWRTAVTTLAFGPILILAPAVWLGVVSRPEDRGLLPDGDPPDADAPEPEEDDVWTMRRAVRDRRLWTLTLVVAPGLTAIGAVVQAMHSHITDLGLSALQASGIIAGMTLMGAFAKPLFGVLADHFDQRAVMALAIAFQATGVGLLLWVESYSALMLTGFVFGLGYGAVMPLWAILLAAIFGRDGFSRVMGVMGPMTLPFTLSGLPFTTFIFERTGSYLPAFAALLGFFLVSAVALAFLRIPKQPSGASLPA
jgi:MFS family permease